jgi:hypothetical protein
VPADLLAEVAAHDRGEEGAEVDAHVEDGEAAVAPRVALVVEPADDGRDVGLEEPVADDEQPEREEQQRLEGHREVTERHQDARR